MSLLEAVGLCKRVRSPSGGSVEIVSDVTLSLSVGDTLAVVGRSGSGKTTLLSLLGLLTRPDNGSLSIAGRDVTQLSDRGRSDLRNRSLGFVFQNYSLAPHLDVRQNVALPLYYRKHVGIREVRREVHDALVAVGMGERERSATRELSGGEQQRVAIARALVGRPSIVLADEPTGSLDSATGDSVLDLLFRSVSEAGGALVVVSHDPGVSQRAGRVAAMVDGRLCEDGGGR